jgi:hypothetical protein
MAACWEKNGLERPTLLANKDNAATLKETAPGDGDSETLTAAELRAVEVSGRGGVKAASIAGAIFNHKDDKKGVHDTHRQYFEVIKGRGRSVTFPDTSNVRYQSYCTAAEELLTYLNDYIKLLIQIRYKKEKRNFSHMEQNLFNALHDSPTLTELAVLVWYSAAVGHPYMYYVRGEGTEETSVLDLGPLHDQVKLHVQKIIDHPDLLLAEDAYAGTGTLDRSDWHVPGAIAAVQQLARDGKLPHLRIALIAFFTGSLIVWNRLTPEFVPGSITASLSDVERASAWMPATNDRNEGALGAYRLHARQRPSLTLHQYNAQALYRHNDTKAFIASSCTDEDLQWLRTKARQMDSSGLETARRAALNAHSEQVARERQEKEARRKAVVAKEKARIDAVSLVLDHSSLSRLTRTQLDDQLVIHRRHDPTIKAKSTYKNKQEKLDAVRAAVVDFLSSSGHPDSSTSTGAVGSEGAMMLDDFDDTADNSESDD